MNQIRKLIQRFRGVSVLLDSDIAKLYGVPNKALLQAVRRNTNRFPADFMFQLNAGELENWRSQIVTSNPRAKMGLRRRPFVFTEQGVAMLSSVLRSEKAIRANIEIMRTFVEMRKVLSVHKKVASRLHRLEQIVGKHDGEIHSIFNAIKQLMALSPEKARRRIGF